MRCQCRILSFKWNDFIPNVTADATSGLDSIINIARARWLGLFGHIARFSRDVRASNILIPHYLLHFRSWISPDLSWKRSGIRPRTTWLDHISSDTGMSLTDTLSLAQDCSQWRAIAMAAKATRIWLTDKYTPHRATKFCMVIKLDDRKVITRSPTPLTLVPCQAKMFVCECWCTVCWQYWTFLHHICTV